MEPLFLIFVSLSATSGGLAAYLALRHLVAAVGQWRRRRWSDAWELLGLGLGRGGYAIIVLLLGYVVLDAHQLGAPTLRLWLYLSGLVIGGAGYLILVLIRRHALSRKRGGAGGPGGTGSPGGPGEPGVAA